MSEAQKQVALVTGASRGIGASIALHLAKSGFVVIGTATSDDGAAKISQALSAFPGSRGANLNVNDAAAGESLIDAIVKEHGGLQVLVNNAGITRDTLACGSEPVLHLLRVTPPIGVPEGLAAHVARINSRSLQGSPVHLQQRAVRRHHADKHEQAVQDAAQLFLAIGKRPLREHLGGQVDCMYVDAAHLAARHPDRKVACLPFRRAASPGMTRVTLKLAARPPRMTWSRSGFNEG